ncbi:hypothetical protein ACW73O_14070 [Faecalibacterium prausnitzii]
MKKFNFESKSFFYLTTFVFVSCFSAILVALDYNRPEYYTYLPLLPAIFALVSTVLFPIYRWFLDSIVITLIISIYFIRMVVTPLSMSLGGYHHLLLNLNVYQEMNQALLLIIYEFIIVFISVFYFKNKYHIEERKNMENKNMLERFSDIKLKVLVLLIFILLIISYILYPQLLNLYKIFAPTSLEEEIRQNVQYHQIKQSVPIIIYYFANFFSEIFRVIIVLILINFFKNKLRAKFAILLSLLVISINGIITTEDNALSVFMLLVYLLLLMKLYPEYKTKLKYTIGIAIPIFAFLLLFFKTGLGYKNSDLNSKLTDLSFMFQAYFSGPVNVAAGIYMNNNFNTDKFLMLIADIFRWIPFVAYFFTNIQDSTELFNSMLFNGQVRRDQIIPYISQSAFYFTEFIAPLLSVLLIKIIFKFERKLNTTNNIDMYVFYTLSIIIFSFSLVAYNISILIRFVFSILLPLYLLTSKKKPD